jgi:hypothetical protein
VVVALLACAACGEAVDDHDLPRPAIRATPTPQAKVGGDPVPQNTSTPDPAETPDNGLPTPIPTPTPTPTATPPMTDGDESG